MMGYQVYYDQEKGIVRADIEGDLVASITGAAALQGRELALTHGCQRYIVDMRQTIVRDSTTTTYMFMEGLEALGFDRTDRIAILYKNDEEKHRFAEMVAHNRGWRNIRYFPGLEEAEEWILKKE